MTTLLRAATAVALWPEAQGGHGLARPSPGKEQGGDPGLVRLSVPQKGRAGLMSPSRRTHGKAPLLSTWETEAVQGHPAPPGSLRLSLSIPFLRDPLRACRSPDATLPRDSEHPTPPQVGQPSLL